MTDTHGTEPHDHDSGHDEFLIHEQDAVHELPSDDEFAEHSATVAEEHNEEHASTTGSAESGHRSALLPVIAAVGGILLLGAVAWWQFGGRTTTAVQPMALSIPTPSPAPVVAATPDLPVASTTANIAPSPMAPAAEVPAANVSPANVPVEPSMQAPTPADVPSTRVMAVAVGTPVSSAPTAPVDQRIQALSSRLDDVQRSLDQTTQQLGQVTNMISATAGTPSGKDLQDRLDKIEQQIASLHPSSPKLAAPMTLSGTEPVAANSAMAKPTASKTHSSSHKVKTTTHKVAVKKSEPEAKAAPSAWVLRSASSGQAWVATSTTAHDLKQVQVGDSLEGIGKVTAIVQNNGNWIVQGTKGVIQ